MLRSFVKNSFVDDGDVQLVTNRFDRNTDCAVSGGNFVYSFLKNKIEAFNLIQPHWPLNPKDFQVIIKNIQNSILHMRCRI